MPKKGFFFTKINDTRIIPVRYKITVVFTLFLIVSNFATNYINLMFGMEQQMKLAKELLAKDLKEFYGFASTQYEISQLNNNIDASKQNIKEKILNDLKDRKESIFLGISSQGEIQMNFSHSQFNLDKLSSSDTEKLMSEAKALNGQGFYTLKHNGKEYFGVFKFSDKWNMYFFLAEEYSEFSKEARWNFILISALIILISLVCTIAGIYAVRYILRYVKVITDSIMEMVKTQKLDLIPMGKAPSDDITYMGMSFNSLSSSIDTLLRIFKKFANQDVAIQAYRDKEIRLEGSKKELAILFSDIKSFTFITETLGTDIIKLINMHYDRAIREIVRYNGAIGSIIGDAILAMFGTMEESSNENKSYSAVMTAYELQAVAESLRQQMSKKKKELIKKKGKLTSDEERVYKAVLLEIGVGIDGGEVFYGNIGSYVRMTNTVIGDNVNAASRLEGLTRVYKVPVICSDYIRDDIEKNVQNNGFTFVEIDTVQVKGKTEGKKVFWPIPPAYMNKILEKQIKIYDAALILYYEGDWSKALTLFKKCGLSVAETFIERVKNNKPPRNWNGIWEMKTK
ncbi:MAG: adenylate/guanylate cyclase domain-containing protein [Spirochaetes bacterium]|nr:adenylate/guanylate cyclase domain-containing protein [Spirochaetota bacterium]